MGCSKIEIGTGCLRSLLTIVAIGFFVWCGYRLFHIDYDPHAGEEGHYVLEYTRDIRNNKWENGVPTPIITQQKVYRWVPEGEANGEGIKEVDRSGDRP